MGVIITIIYMTLRNVVGNLAILILGMAVGVIAYFVALILLKGIDEDDLKKMPGGKTVLTVAKKCKLL